MSDSDSKSNPEESPGRTSAGAMLREARLAAGLDAARMAADLRISLQAFEALETSQYHLLPGDPYVRALLSSLARQLHLDPQVVMKAYGKEMGVTAHTGQVAPYEDRDESMTTSHRKILIALMVLLLVGFVFVLRQLNKPGADKTAAAAADSAESALNDSPTEEDSLPESSALQPDSLDEQAGGAAGGEAGSGSNAAVGDSAAKAGEAAKAAPDTAKHVTIFRATGDSVWVRLIGTKGKPDTFRLLKMGQTFKVVHSDTLRIALSEKGKLLLELDGKVMNPSRKRFKLFGTYYQPY